MVCQSRVRVSHSNSTMRTLKEAVASSRDFSVVWRRILQWTDPNLGGANLCLQAGDKPTLERGVLVFDVLAQDGDGRTAAGASEVRRAPERTLVKEAKQIGEGIFELARGCALEGVDQLGHAHCRRVVQQKVNMVCLSVKLGQCCAKVASNLREALLQVVKVCRVERTTAVFGHKDQMHMQDKNAVASTT